MNQSKPPFNNFNQGDSIRETPKLPNKGNSFALTEQENFNQRHNHDGINSAKLETASGGANISIGSGSRTTAQGTGDVTITCNFTPKLIIIFAWADVVGGQGGWSNGRADANLANSMFGYAYSGTVWEKLSSTTKCLFVWDNGESNNTQASVTAVSSTGLTLNFSAVAVNVAYQYIIIG